MAAKEGVSKGKELVHKVRAQIPFVFLLLNIYERNKMRGSKDSPQAVTEVEMEQSGCGSSVHPLPVLSGLKDLTSACWGQGPKGRAYLVLLFTLLAQISLTNDRLHSLFSV